MTWVPPTGGAPTGPTPPAGQPATPPAAPAPATPSATAPVAPAPTTASRGLSTGWVIGIAVVGAILAGSLIGGIGTGISQANSPSTPYYPYYPDPVDPVVDGGSPVAAEPLECAAACFDLETALTAKLDDSVFVNASLPQTTDVSAYPQLTAAEAMDRASGVWDDVALAPDWCFPTYSPLPIAETQGSDVGDGAVVTFADHRSDLGSPTSLVQTIRLFDDTASAENYMYDLDAALSQCDLYSAEDGSTEATVSRDDALHPPASVAALGFIRDDGIQMVRIFDIQRGNVVIRSVYTTTSTYDNGKFRPVVQQQADMLDELVPLN